jgi:hypothetical protein
MLPFTVGVDVGDLVDVNVGDGVFSNVGVTTGNGVFFGAGVPVGEIPPQAVTLNVIRVIKLARVICLNFDIVLYSNNQTDWIHLFAVLQTTGGSVDSPSKRENRSQEKCSKTRRVLTVRSISRCFSGRFVRRFFFTGYRSSGLFDFFQNLPRPRDDMLFGIFSE